MEKSGERFSGQVLTIESVENLTTNMSSPLVLLQGVENSVSYVKSDGTVDPGTEEKKVNFRLELRWTANGWRVKTVSNV